jgi:hypothetical protein
MTIENDIYRSGHRQFLQHSCPTVDAIAATLGQAISGNVEQHQLG